MWRLILRWPKFDQVKREMPSLYETDTVLWSRQQAEALRSAARSGSNAAVDWENVAEEIEDLGRSRRTQLNSHLRTIIEHLMKLEASPAGPPRLGWKETILRVRGEIEDLLEDSPSLRREIGEAVGRQTSRAARDVAASLQLHGEAPRRPLQELCYSEDQVLGPWFPAD